MPEPEICQQCGTEIEMDENWFPTDGVLMCQNSDKSQFMIHLHCYTKNLHLA